MAPILLEPHCRLGARNERGERPGLEAVPRTTALQDAVGRHGMPDPLQRQRAERLQFEEACNELGRVAADDNLARLARSLKPGCHVRNLAPHVGQPVLAARRHGRHQHLARVDADAGLEVVDAQVGRKLAAEPHDVVDDGDSGRQRVPTRRFQGLRIAEVRDGPVSLELGNHAAVRGDDRRHAVLVRVQHVVPILGIECGGQLRRADEIREHHGQLAPLSGVGRTHRAASIVGRAGWTPGPPRRRRTLQIYVCPGRDGSPEHRDFGTRAAVQYLRRQWRWTTIPPGVLPLP